jgi:hypothetical protein
MGGRRDIDRIERPDIDIHVGVKAKKLRFEQVPESEVEFWGDPGVDSVSGSERENLPDEVDAGRTYKDIKVRWRAAARIRETRPNDKS